MKTVLTFRRSSSIATFILFASISASFAQPKAPKAFYEHEFAGAPRIEGQEAPLAYPHKLMSKVETRTIGREIDRPLKDVTPSRERGDPTHSEQPYYRISVSLYVASHDKGHFEGVMRRVFSLNAKNQGAHVTEVYHIGDERNVSTSIKDEALARNIYISPLYQPPTDLNIESSPAWVLRDIVTKQVHTVEGILDIDKCITAKGEYRTPERSMFEAAPTPTIGVKGF